MKKPINEGIVQLIQNPEKAKLFMEYMKYSQKRNRTIFLIKNSDGSLDIIRKVLDMPLSTDKIQQALIGL